MSLQLRVSGLPIPLPLPPLPGVVLPTLPQVFLDTTLALLLPPAITPTTDFQAALNAAQPGDVIMLRAGTTFRGPFTLPAKAGTGWINVISSAFASLPAPGMRAGAAQAALKRELR